jgi:LysR family glycine cleavage system transcriptional activator
VAGLEAALGLQLFERIRQRIVPTEAGRAYAAEIRDILSRLQTATLSTMAMKNVGGTLSLALLPTFGTRWLIPRLPDFFARHPEIAIDFSTRIVPFDFAREPFDAAIHFGDPTWPGTEAHRLMGEMIVPVASPAFLAREGITAPEDLVRVPLLRQATRPQGWAEWFEAQGLDPETARPGPRFEQFAMVAQAAVAGLGVAVVPRFLIEDELKSGQLVIPFDRPVESRQSYWLVYPTAQGERPALKSFRDWLLQAVGR